MSIHGTSRSKLTCKFHLAQVQVKLTEHEVVGLKAEVAYEFSAQSSISAAVHQGIAMHESGRMVSDFRFKH